MRSGFIKAIAFLAIPFAAFALSGNTYAEGEEGIEITMDSKLSNPSCRISDYASDYYGGRSLQLCSEIYGYSPATFDEDTKTLTLNEGSDSFNIFIDYRTPTELKIETTGSHENIGIDVLYQDGDAVHTMRFDFGSKMVGLDFNGLHTKVIMDGGIWKNNASTFVPSGLIINNGNLYLSKGLVIRDDTLQINNGNFQTKSITSYNDISIKNGNVEVAEQFVSYGNNTTIEGGSLKVENGIINLIGDDTDDKSNNASITGGYIKAGGLLFDGCKAGRLYVANDSIIDLTHGEMSGNVGLGLWGDGREIFTTYGGTIRIDGFDIGMYSYYDGEEGGGIMRFDGGIALTIWNAQRNMVFETSYSDSHSARIRFGDDIEMIEEDGDEESTYGFVLNATNDEGFGTDGVGYELKELSREEVLALGLDYKEGYDYRYIGDGGKLTITKKSQSEDDDIKVPDTSTINSKEGGALAIFTATTFVILSAIAVAGIHKKHASGHFKFDK